MDDASEAGLDLELREFGRRLDSLLIARNWNPKAPPGRREPFELSAVRAAAGRMRLTLDATLPEATARRIIALVVAAGLPAPEGEDGSTDARGAPQASSAAR